MNSADLTGGRTGLRRYEGDARSLACDKTASALYGWLKRNRALRPVWTETVNRWGFGISRRSLARNLRFGAAHSRERLIPLPVPRAMSSGPSMGLRQGMT